jgi:ribosome biogenesis protein NSA1
VRYFSIPKFDAPTTSSQLFMSDGGSTLSSIDLRTGTILHRYRGKFIIIIWLFKSYNHNVQGISGAVTSIAPSPTVMLSVSLDRFARVCSILPPPQIVGENQERKPEVLEKCYLGSTPTVVIWDENIDESGQKSNEDDEIWDKLENIR